MALGKADQGQIRNFGVEAFSGEDSFSYLFCNTYFI